MRSLFLFVLLGLAACDSDFQPLVLDQTPPTGSTPTAPIPPGSPASGESGGGEGSGTVQIRFDDSAIDLGRPGGFPSDLVANSSGVLLTVDDAMVPCNVVAHSSGAVPAGVLSVKIAANHLADMDGGSPARAPTTFGSGLFGAFTGDMELAFDRWLLVTVGAGNSASSAGSKPLHLANLVVIDTLKGEVVQTVNLGWTLTHSGKMSDGAPFTGIPQSLPVMCSFVPAGNGTQTGRIYVALSNGAGSSAGLGIFYPGTVQVWSANFNTSSPISVHTTGKSSVDVTRTYVAGHFNPVGLTLYTAQRGTSFLIVTSAGASRFDASYVLLPTTETFLEFIDLDTGEWRDQWALNLGAVLPAPHRIVLGVDGFGTHYGLLASQTYGAAYLIDLTGLESNPVDTDRLARLRHVDLVPGGAATAGSDFLTGIVITPSGRNAVVSSFDHARLRVLSLPADIRFGAIAVDPTPFDDASLGASQAMGLGALAAPAGAAAEIYAIVNGSFDLSFNPVRSAHIGTLSAEGRLR
ncbi:MAG: hypothetical protein ACYSX0_16060 [Planctomycetota bacterium]|jgi:hypothetical protein